MCFIDASDIHSYTKHVSPTLSTSSTLWCIEFYEKVTEFVSKTATYDIVWCS